MRLIVPLVLAVSHAVASVSASEPILASDIYIGNSAKDNSCGDYGRPLTVQELQRIPQWCQSLALWETYRAPAGTDIYWTARKTPHACELSPASNPNGNSLCVATVKPQPDKLTSLNELFTVKGSSCDVGRPVRYDELPPSFMANPDFCGNLLSPPSLFGSSVIGLRDASDNPIQIWPQHGCETFNFDDEQLEQFTKDNLFSTLCYADPPAYQVNAFEDSNFVNAHEPMQGRPKMYINRSTSMRGKFNSFKIGQGVTVDAYSGDNLDGSHQQLTSSTGKTNFTVKSFEVHLDLPTPPPEPEGPLTNGPGTIQFANSFDAAQKLCRVELSTSLDVRSETFYATMLGTSAGRVPNSTYTSALTFAYDPRIDGYSAVHYEPMSDVNECFVTNMFTQNFGAADIAYKQPHEGTATWKDLPKTPGPIADIELAARLVAKPFVEKLSTSRQRYTNVLDAYGIRKEYDTFIHRVTEGASGITHGYYGFYPDLLGRKGKDAVLAFLQEKLIKPALELGLIDSQFGNTHEFIEAVYKEVFGGLGQDTEGSYGTEEQARVSILSLANFLPPTWQRDNLAEALNLDIDALLKGKDEYLYQHAYNDDDEASFAEIIAAVAYAGADETLLRELFGRNANIEVDYEKGMISYAGRVGGYLGRTFLDVAADIYDVETDDLAADQIMIVKTALESLGIDTMYSYGSIRNIKSSMMHRMAREVDSEELAESLADGSAPEMFDAVSERLDDSGDSILEMSKQLLADLVTFSHLPTPNKNLVWRGMSDVENARAALEEFNTTIGYEDDDTPIWALPFTDEAWTKGYLYDLGIDRSLVDERWLKFAERGCEFFHHNGKVVCFTRVANTVYAGQTVPEEVLKNEIAFNEAYMAETGRTGYSPRDMWKTSFHKMAVVLGKYAGAYIELEARLRGIAPWVEDNLSTREVRLSTKVEQWVQPMKTGGSTKRNFIEPEYWIVQGDNLPYTVRTLPGAQNLLQLANLELVKAGPYEQNPNLTSTYVVNLMVPNSMSRCQSNAVPNASTTCQSSYHTYRRKIDNTQALLEIALGNYLSNSAGEFQTVDMLGEAEGRIMLAILKSMLPLWSTVDSIIKGNNKGVFLGLISDAMFFVPVGARAGRLAKAVIKAVKPDFGDGIRYLGSAVGLNRGSGIYAINASPNRVLYRQLAVQAAKDLGKEVLAGLNPLGTALDLRAFGLSIANPKPRPPYGI